MRTSNPTLNEKVFADARDYSSGAATMTVPGTVQKCFILLALLMCTAGWIWSQAFTTTGPMFAEQAATATAMPPVVMGAMTAGAILGFITAMVTIFKKEWVAVTAPLYALFEGLFIGGISALMEQSYPGIVIQAVGLTFATMFCLLVGYQSGMIRATDKFRRGIFAATGAIMVVYLVSMVMGFFGASIPLIHSSGPMGIGFSLIVVTIAALNLVLDFDFIEKGAAMGAPKRMEWFGAFGLMVTLVWLYVEILRLLAKLRDRR